MRKVKLFLSFLIVGLSLANACSPDENLRGCSLKDSPANRYNGLMLIEFVKNQVFNQGISVEQWLVKMVHLNSAKMNGTTVILKFFVAPTRCKIQNGISLAQLYSEECPIQKEMLWKKCKGFFSMKDNYSSMSCFKSLAPRKKDPEVANSVKGELAKINLDEDDSSDERIGLRVHSVVKEHIFHSSFYIDEWYVRLVRMYENRETENGLFVKFSLAPSLCSNSIRIALEQLYSSSCPIIQNDDWMLCSGIILNRAIGDYRITCRTIIRSDNKNKNPDKPVNSNTSTVVSTSVEVIQATTVLRQLIFAEVLEFNGWYARVVELHTLKRESSTAFVEFTIAPSKCNVRAKVSLDQLYSNVCPVDITQTTVVCQGTVFYNSNGKHTIVCGERAVKTPLPSEFPPLAKQVEINIHSNHEEIIVVLANLLTEKKLETAGRSLQFTSLSKVVKQDTYVYVEFTATPGPCGPSVQDPKEQSYKPTCGNSAVVILCKGNLPYSPKEKPTIECKETERDPNASTSTPQGTPDHPAAQEFEETQEVITSIKEFMIEERITIDGRQAWLDKVINYKKHDETIEIEFSIVDIFYGQSETPSSHGHPEGFSPQKGSKKKATCKGTISLIPGIRNKYECTLPELIQQRPGSLFPILAIPTPADVGPSNEIENSIKRLLVTERISIDGRYVRLETLTSQKRVETGLAVEFTVTDTSCDSTIEISLNKIYSELCEQSSKKKMRRCEGILSFLPGVKDHIKCDERTYDVEQVDPTRPPMHGDAPTDLTTKEGITKSVRLVIFTETMTIKGRHARVEQLIKYEKVTTGVRVEFSIAETICDGRLKVTLDQIYSSLCSRKDMTTLFICKGVLPYEKGAKHTIRCSGGDKLTETDPSRPSFGDVSSTVIRTIERSEVVHKVERLVFVEKMTITGHYVRVDKLTRYERTTAGMDIVFTIVRTKCNNKVMVTIDQLYSSMCLPESSPDPIVCKGILPFEQTFIHRIKCTFSDGTEVLLGSTPQRPVDDEVEKTPEVAEISTQIQRIMFSKGLTISGKRVRLDTLIKHKKVSTGTEVEFTVIETTSSINEQITVEQLYTRHYVQKGFARKLICKGVIFTLKELKDNVQCSERDDIEAYDPSEPSTPGTHIIIDPNNVNSHELTISIKKLMFSETMTIKGKHVQVDKLLKHKVVAMGVEVEFTILRTTCEGVLKISLEQIYSDICAITETSTVVVCKGLLPFQSIMKHSIRCSQGDKLSPESDPWTAPTNLVQSIEYSEVLHFVERFVFIEKMSINERYVRVDELSKHETYAAGMNFIFTVRTTTCTTETRLTMDYLYSSSCPLEQHSAPVVCTGHLPFKLTVPHNVSCIFSNGTSTPLTPMTKRPEESQIIESAEVSEITSLINQLIINERLTVRGQRAKLDMLIFHRKVETGIKVEFTIVGSGCAGNIQLTVQQLYGQPCTRLGYGKKLICKAVISTVRGVKDYVRCSERNDIEEVETSRPSTSGRVTGTIQDPITVSSEKVMISIKRLMFSETMTINGRHVRVEKLNSAETVASGVLVDFSIAETTCSSMLEVTLEEIYSERCEVVQKTTLVICKGLLPQKRGDNKHRIRCSDGDKLTEDPSSRPSKPSTGDKEKNVDNVKVLDQIKRRLFTERFTVNGGYARVTTLKKATPVSGGAIVEFIISESVCSTRLTITLEQLYSAVCRPKQPLTQRFCKGRLPSNPQIRHSIECTDVKDTEEQDEATSPDDQQTEENTEITISIMRLIRTQSIIISGQYARFDKLISHKKVQTGIEVEFIVRGPESDTEISSGQSIKEIHTSYTKKLICKGILSLTPGIKDTVKCEKTKDDDEKVHPSQPSTPEDSHGTPTTAEKVTELVKEFIFVEAMTIGGRHARVEKLIKYEKTSTGIQVEFSIYETTCHGTLKIPLQQIYSSLCRRVDAVTVVICKGTLPLSSGMEHTIRCSGGDKLTEIDPSTPSRGNDSSTSAEGTEHSILLRKVERLVFFEKTSISGYYVRVDKLTKFVKVATGVGIRFTIKQTTCARKTTLTIEQLYSSKCTVDIETEPVVCHGILPFHQTFVHQIKCYFNDGTEMPLSPKPQSPIDSDDLDEPAEMAEITTQIKQMIISKKLTINGQHARLDTLVTHKKFENGIEVEFIIIESTCASSSQVTMQQLYSKFCIRPGYGKRLICKGMIFVLPGMNHNVQCSERDDVDEYDPSEPSTPGSDELADPTTISTEKITTSIKILMLSERMTINGHHVRVKELTSYEKVISGVYVQFTLVETTYNGSLKVPLEALYSRQYAEVQTTSIVVCKGLIPARIGIQHTIRCSGGDKLTERSDLTEPKPGETTPAEVAETVTITASIKRLIISEKITVDGATARFDTLISHKKTGAGIEVVFVVTDPESTGEPGETFGLIRTETFTRLGYTKKLICRGVLSHMPGESGNVICEEPNDYIEQIDPSGSFTPEDPRADMITVEIISKSVKELLFIEAMTINGHHARLERLKKYQKVSTGVQVEFSISETTCEGKLKIPFQYIYSTMCSRAETTTVVTCKGTLPFDNGVKHNIRCSGGDKLTKEVKPSSPSGGGDSSADVQSLEYSKMVRLIQRLVFIEKMTIGGYYVRVEKLTKYEKATGGIEVTFTIKQTTSTSQVAVTIDELYSSKYDPQGFADPVTCKGILPFERAFMHKIKCFFPNGTQTPLAPQAHGRTDDQIQETTEIAEITTKIKRVMIAKKLTINGQHARLDTLIKYKKVENGIEVEFTITETTCDSSVQLTKEQLYGLSCLRQTYGKKLVCKGIIFNVLGLGDNIQCSEEDDVDEFDPSRPSSPSSNVTDPTTAPTTISAEEVTISIRKLMFSERMSINGHHIRVEKLISHHRISSGIIVEFNIVETTCSHKLKLTLETIYSHRCTEVQSITTVVCKGMLPLRDGVTHTIRCSDGDKLTEGYDPEPSVPSDAESAEKTDSPEILSKLKLLVFVEKFSIHGRHVRVRSLKKADDVAGGTQVVFTITATVCDIQLRITLKQLYEGFCPTQQPSVQETCKGVLPSDSQKGHSIKCVGSKGNHEPNKPSIPAPGQSTPTETVEITKITTSIKRLITTQNITVNGQAPRFETLITHKRTESGIEIVFTVADPRYHDLDENSFGMVRPGYQETSIYGKKLICKGILSLAPGVRDSLKCEELEDGKASGPSTPGIGDARDPSTASSEEVTIVVQKLMFTETMTINGHHVRVEKLIRRETVNSGLFVEFTIVETTCSGRLKITMENIYSHRCPQVPGVALVVCKGFLPLVPGVNHMIRCSGGDKLNQPQVDPTFIPGETVISDPNNRTHVAEFLKRIIYFDRTYLRGYYPRVVSMSGFEPAGYEELQVQFSIAASNCSSLHEVSLQELYTNICPVNECCSWLTCTGTLPLSKRRNYNIRCVIAVTFNGHL